MKSIMKSETMWTILLLPLVTLIVPKGDCASPPSPVLNKCCPGGSKYQEESGECVQIVVEDKLIDVNNKSHSQKVSSDGGDDFLNLPKKLVLFIPDDKDRNSSDYFQFRLEHNAPACVNGSFTVQIQLNSLPSSNKSVNEGNTGYKLISDGSSDFSLISSPLFTVDGQLRIQKEEMGLNYTDYFSTPEFCISDLTNEAVTIRVCNPTCRGDTPCIRKCCDMDQVWNQMRAKRHKCSPAGPHHWSPIFYKDAKTEASPDEVKALHPHYKIVHPRDWCNLSVYKAIVLSQLDRNPMGGNHTRFRIITNGGVLKKSNRYDWNATEYNPSFYCLDGRMNAPNLDPSLPNETEYSGNDELNTILFDCGPNPPREPKNRGQTTLYGIAMIFSCFFLLLMLIVYCLLFEKQRVHGWTIMSYAASLFCMYVCFVLMYFSQSKLIRQRVGRVGVPCYVLAVALHFFFLSTFSWISMVNFDLWSTFRNLKPTSGRSKGLRRYLTYAAFSLGLPIIVVSVALSLDSTYGDDYDSGVIVPEYAQTICFLDPVYAQLYYAYAPAGVLLAMNLIFFIITIYSMYQIQQSTKIATSSSSTSKSQQQKQSRWPTRLVMKLNIYKVQLFAKLLFVMGIPWIFEVISWSTEHGKRTELPWYWTLFDMINCLQAVAIFYTFVCKADIIHSLEQKYPRFKNFLNSVLLDPEKAESIIKSYPKLKGLIKPITRRQMEQTSAHQVTETSSYHSSRYSINHGESTRRGDRDQFSMRSQPDVF